MVGYELAEGEDAAGTETSDISGVRARLQLLF